MRCLICHTKMNDDGSIIHKRNCPDWYRPNHITVPVPEKNFQLFVQESMSGIQSGSDQET